MSSSDMPRSEKLRNFFAETTSSDSTDIDEAASVEVFLPREGEIFEVITSIVKPDVVLEFGSWLGRSVFSWLSVSQPPQIVVAVDTFLGSSEHWLDFHKGGEFSKSNLELSEGSPDFRKTFMKNLNSVNLKNKVYPFVGTTQTAYEVFSFNQLEFPLVYIDGAHDQNSLTIDLALAFNLLPPKNSGGGAILGDDYASDWPDVQTAVQAFSETIGEPFAHGKGRFVFYTYLDDENALLLRDELITKLNWSIYTPCNSSPTINLVKFKIPAILNERIIQNSIREDLEKRLEILQSEKQNAVESNNEYKLLLGLQAESLRNRIIDLELIHQSRTWKLISSYTRFKRLFTGN